MLTTRHHIVVAGHPGSSRQEIRNEPDWGSGHEHRVGFRNLENRVPGLTHSGDERDDSDVSQDVEADQSQQRYHDFEQRVREGKLLNFRDFINAQDDLHLRRPEVHSEGWRYVLNATEDWIKNTEEWPANLQKKEKEEEERQTNAKKQNEQISNDKIQQEHEWRRGIGEDSKHHDAYAGHESEAHSEELSEDEDENENEKSEYDLLREKYSPQEIALLRSLQHEKDYIYNLEQSDGKRRSPVTHADPLVSIDEADQFTPDNWIPRSPNLIRLTGKVCLRLWS